ncbi:hypothetical protein CHS0354_004344 [Potamilus streckersoni]|uniref:Uncharacterized protein n=1 Tax=Potamilus streckersoni TaxID=2493646 RepID=A0AAE0SH48_9BIVA|nr:hypothetical protein CHS0354_004344 [Potamilus streckersoni]
MAAFLRVPSSAYDVNNKLHLVPCSIHHDGPARVAEFFDANVKKDGDKNLTTSFRGRPLCGESFPVPCGYTGVVIKETRKPFTEEEDRHITGIQTFNQFTYWNLDREATANDKIRQTMDWIDIAKVIHRPVEDDSSQKSVVEN